MRCSPDTPSPCPNQNSVFCTFPKPISPLLSPISVTSNHSLQARTWWSRRNPPPHHLPQPVRYKILCIPLYGSLQSLPYPHHHCLHISGTLCLTCTAVRATSLVSQSPTLLPVPFPHSLHHPQSYFSEMQITPLLRPFRIKANFKWPSVPFRWPLPK